MMEQCHFLKLGRKNIKKLIKKKKIQLQQINYKS